MYCRTNERTRACHTLDMHTSTSQSGLVTDVLGATRSSTSPFPNAQTNNNSRKKWNKVPRGPGPGQYERGQLPEEEENHHHHPPTKKGPEKRGQTPLGSDFFFLLFGPSSVDPGRRARVCECLPEARARMHTVICGSY